MEPCGCATREEHADPHVDPTLHIEHGERSELNNDPLPHDVPDTGGWNGTWTRSPDIYCLCGHPDYITCAAWLAGDGVLGLTLHNVGGYYFSTRS